MGIISSLKEQELNELVLLLLIGPDGPLAGSRVPVADVQRFARRVVTAIDLALDNTCRPHDWVRMGGNETKMACARCGEEAPRDFRLVPPVILDPAVLNPVISAIDEVMKTSSGTITMRKKEPGEETRL